MRTISENINSSHELSIVDKIPILNIGTENTEKKSCFYEVGVNKAATFWLFSDAGESKIIKYIRSHGID